jgi:ferredoxin
MGDPGPGTGRFFVDPAVCVAHEACVHDAPTLFAIHSDGSSQVILQPSTPEELRPMRRAIEGCPVMAIIDRDASKRT